MRPPMVSVFPSRTDMFGLALLEPCERRPGSRLSGDGARDVIGDANVGVLDVDLQRACLGALDCSRQDCREFALRMTWAESARIFLEHVGEATRPARGKPVRVAA